MCGFDLSTADMTWMIRLPDQALQATPGHLLPMPGVSRSLRPLGALERDR